MGLMGYYLIAGIMFVIGLIVSNRLKSKFKEYRDRPFQWAQRQEIAEKMLSDNGIYDVRLISVEGHLTGPQYKTVNILLFVNSRDRE
jgi:uncharacterized protein